MSLQPFTCDVAVVGSGPAGASAARTAAAAGLDVLILEKARIPRYKTCGGGILGRAVRLLGAPSLPMAERTCCKAEFVLSPGLHFMASRNHPIVYMTMRDAFDQWLTQRAIDAGARVRCDCMVHDVVMNDGEVRLTTNQGEVRARYVVAADGAGGLTARKAGWPDHRQLVPALECEVSVSTKDFARLSESAQFDFHAVQKGYAWVFPKKSHLSIGVLTLNSAGVNLNECFDRYLHFLGISNPISIQRHGFVIPIAPRGSVFARGGILVVGDAAGFADPVTAEGISNAIFSGQLAGQSIARGFSNDLDVSELYNNAVESKIIPELRWARRLAKILYGSPRLRDALFRWQGQRITELMTDLVADKTSYSSLMNEPSNYLKLLAANAPIPRRQFLR
jgi:geranylgeranyl reductase family protein